FESRPFRQIQISGCFYISCEVKKNRITVKGIRFFFVFKKFHRLSWNLTQMGLRLDDEQDITATSFTVMAILIPLTFKARPHGGA
ncbi:hypothetical protein DXN22_23795, partial [Salmonella enterica subsp. enterica serovar Enteritidis]